MLSIVPAFSPPIDAGVFLFEFRAILGDECDGTELCGAESGAEPDV